MKTLISTVRLSLLILVLSSCRKEKTTFSDQTVIGQWQWIQSSGGFVGNQVVKPSITEFVTLTLNKDLTYVASLNNQPMRQGSFYFTTLQSGNTVIHFDKVVQVETLLLQEQQLLEHADNTNLALFDYNVSEGRSHEFQKVK
jgi:hypothetical protein